MNESCGSNGGTTWALYVFPHRDEYFSEFSDETITTCFTSPQKLQKSSAFLSSKWFKSKLQTQRLVSVLGIPKAKSFRLNRIQKKIFFRLCFIHVWGNVVFFFLLHSTVIENVLFFLSYKWNVMMLHHHRHSLLSVRFNKTSCICSSSHWAFL